MAAVPARRRVSVEDGRAAVQVWAERAQGAGGVSRDVLSLAVRYTPEELAARAPGGSTEVRVPPFAVVQCVPGPRHTRATPPNVVETDAATWLAMATGWR
jgi:hypothetical protein